MKYYKIMKFRISNKTFYDRHNDELKKYIKFEETLHIVNSISKDKVNFDECEVLVVDFYQEDINEKISINKTYA